VDVLVKRLLLAMRCFFLAHSKAREQNMQQAKAVDVLTDSKFRIQHSKQI